MTEHLLLSERIQEAPLLVALSISFGSVSILSTCWTCVQDLEPWPLSTPAGARHASRSPSAAAGRHAAPQAAAAAPSAAEQPCRAMRPVQQYPTQSCSGHSDRLLLRGRGTAPGAHSAETGSLRGAQAALMSPSDAEHVCSIWGGHPAASVVDAGVRSQQAPSRLQRLTTEGDARILRLCSPGLIRMHITAQLCCVNRLADLQPSREVHISISLQGQSWNCVPTTVESK